MSETSETPVKVGSFRPYIPPQERQPKRITRRKFLEIVKNALIVAVGVGTGAKLLGSTSTKPSPVQEETPLQTTESSEAGEQETPHPLKPEAFNLVFGDLPQEEKEAAREIVEKMKEVIQRNPSYQEMLAVTRKWEGFIRENVKRVNFPPELALGIIFVENGGEEDLISPAGARGVAQLMKKIARFYGLVVERWKDEREDPRKSIEVMAKYLKDLNSRFGSLGLTVWAYHAGEGNVYNAIQEYSGNVYGIKLPNIMTATQEAGQKAFGEYNKFLEKSPNIHHILNNPGVKQKVLSQLEDETELYVYKVVAAAELFTPAIAI